MRCHTPFALAALAILTSGLPTSGAEPHGQEATFNIVRWDGGALPPRYERTEQLPLSGEDIIRLTRSRFAAGQIVRMAQERRFAGDASAAGLIALKEAGVEPEVLQALSLHALPPNRSLNLTVELSFEGASRQARGRYLYILILDEPRPRLFSADLNEVLSGRWRHDLLTDGTDPVLPRQIRRVTFTGEVALKTYGQKKVQVFTSARPDIQTLQDIPERDRGEIRAFTIDYPACSLRRDCLLQVRYRQDAALPGGWRQTRSDLTCEWN